MRPALAASMLVIAFPLAAGPASAEPSRWVDPPAKGASEDAAPVAKPEPQGSKPQETSAERPATEATETAGTPGTSRAAEAPVRRPKAAEIRRGRRVAARAAPPNFGADEPDAGASGQAGAAERLAQAYLRTVSAPGMAMVAATPRFYGEQVRFHGRLMSLSALAAEKSRFVRRWPERRYAPHGAMRTACQGATCTVRTAFDFRARNAESGARSGGSAELTLTIDFASGDPRIVSESSRVLRYGGPLVEQAERPGRGA